MEAVVSMGRFWQGRRVLLTGHTGFKGAWLGLWLESLGAEVVGYALAPEIAPSLFAVARVERGVTSIEGDLLDAETLAAVVNEYRPEIVFHLAAQSLVRRSYREPAATFAANVQGTVHLLEAVRRSDSIRAVVVVTSDKCYENREWPWGYRENDPMGGHDPYSASKGCAELVVGAYRRSFFTEQGIPLASARAGNVIGGGDWAEDRLVPDAMRAFEAGATLVVRNPDARRPWQHVLEPLHGYLLLARRLIEDRDSCARAWNFGPDAGDTRSVGEVVARIAALWGPRQAHWTVDAPAAGGHEAMVLRLDSGLAQARLGWRPILGLDEALEWTLTWYRAHQAGHTDMRNMTLEQILRFQERLPIESSDRVSNGVSEE